ncbi:MAG: fibronectin type III domain-containing protein [Bacteroidales bacterium]|nr:fibronectin type III domain-containing protein [Bacteroidales bacterium]
MKSSLYTGKVILLVGFFIVSSEILDAQTYRILPLGNSITEGFDASAPTESERVAYRKELYDGLTSAGYNFDLVGHKNSGYALFSDADHGGIPGSRAQYIVRLLRDGFDERNNIQITPDGMPYLDVYPADIILIHIGTNDITHGEGSSAFDVGNILDEIDAWEASSGTHVAVFVARIIQRTDDPALNDATIQLNDNVAIMVAGRGDPGIFMVNIESGAGIDYAAELKEDGIHPEQSAYDKMGYKWYLSLNEYLSAIPEAPTELSLSGETASSIDLSWNDNSGNETGFEIERSLAHEGGSFTLIYTTEAGVTSYTDSNLDHDTQYFYRVRAVNATGPSLYTSIENTYTLSESLAAPTGLSVSVVDEHSVLLSWQDNSMNETGFRIERSLSSGSDYEEIHTTSANVTSYLDNTLIDGTEYFYRVCATTSGPNSDYSNVANVSTELAAPTGLTANVVEGNSILLSWEDNSASEIGYRIERSLTSGSGFTEIHVTLANVTSYTDDVPEDETIYYYRVCATNALGNSVYSNEADANIELAAPTGLSASTLNDKSVALIWKDNSNSETGYRIERSLSSGSGYAVIEVAQADIVFYMDDGLEENEDYFYRVCATRGGFYSEYSNEASAITELTAPGGLSTNTLDEHSIRLSWEDNSNKESGYIIERSFNSGTGYDEIQTTSVDDTAYTDDGLQDGKEYFYRVRATGNGNYSKYCREDGTATLLSVPTGLTATAIDEHSIRLLWEDNSVNETGYKIQRSLNPGSGFAEIGITVANEINYNDEGLQDETEYFYRICATNALDDSEYSNEASAITKRKDPLNEPEIDSLFSFYPNPNDGNLIIVIKNLEEYAGTGYLRLADFSGTVHFNREIDLTNYTEGNVFEIQLPKTLKNGFYSIILIAGNRTVAEKFVLIQ